MQAKQIRQLAADFGLYCGTAEDVQELESRSFEAKSNLRMFAITSDEPINEDFDFEGVDLPVSEIHMDQSTQTEGTDVESSAQAKQLLVRDQSTQTENLCLSHHAKYIYTVFCDGLPAVNRSDRNLADILFGVFAELYPARGMHRSLAQEWFTVTKPPKGTYVFIHLLSDEGCGLFVHNINDKVVKLKNPETGLYSEYKLYAHPAKPGYYRRLFEEFVRSLPRQ